MCIALSLFLEIKDMFFIGRVPISHHRAVDRSQMQKIEQASASHYRVVDRHLSGFKLHMQKIYRFHIVVLLTGIKHFHFHTKHFEY